MAKSGFAKEHLRSYIDRIERLEEERAAIGSDIKEIYAEAKGTGFDTKIMRMIVRCRKLDKAEFQEQQSLFDLYWDALHGDPVAVSVVVRRAEQADAQEANP